VVFVEILKSQKERRKKPAINSKTKQLRNIKKIENLLAQNKKALFSGRNL